MDENEVARNRYHVHALDISDRGVDKTSRLAKGAGVHVRVFQADLNVYRLNETFDILFSTGTLHCSLPSVRDGLFENYKVFTATGRLHVFSVFVTKPFIASAPDASSGVPHQHVVNRIVARRPASLAAPRVDL